MYAPAAKVEPLVAPPGPEIDVGPAALTVQAPGEAVPPLLLTTIFVSVKLATMSSFVIVHVKWAPGANVPEHPALSVLA